MFVFAFPQFVFFPGSIQLPKTTVGGCGLVAVECFAAMLFVSDFLQVAWRNGGKLHLRWRADIPGVGCRKIPGVVEFFFAGWSVFKYLK